MAARSSLKRASSAMAKTGSGRSPCCLSHAGFASTDPGYVSCIPHPHAVRDRPKVNDAHGEGDVPRR